MQSSNLYLYCINNPVRWIDPKGKYISDWDKAVLPAKSIARLEEIDKEIAKAGGWAKTTTTQRQAWSVEAEAMRSVWRNPNEYTDSSGITRSTITKSEIKFYKNDNVMMSSTETRMVMSVGYSINSNNAVVLADSRQSARFVNASMGTYHTVTSQSFTTDGTKVSYDVKYKSITTFTLPLVDYDWEFETDGGHVWGTIERINFK